MRRGTHSAELFARLSPPLSLSIYIYMCVLGVLCTPNCGSLSTRSLSEIMILMNSDGINN
jgi:hypothetical protein